MIDLYHQIASFLFSFFFGALLYFSIQINRNLTESSSIMVQILISIVFVFDVVLFYFIGLRMIHSAFFHFYFLIFIILGYLSCNFVSIKVYRRIEIKTTK